MQMIRFIRSAAALLAFAGVSQTAIAQQTYSAEQAALRFGARGSVQNISMSPSGTKIAYIAPLGAHGEVVYVVDLNGNATPKGVLNNNEDLTDISYCDWATETRLVCGIYALNEQSGRLRGFSRLVAVDAAGGNLDLLSRTPTDRALGVSQFGGSILALDVEGEPDKVLMTRVFVPEYTTGTRLASELKGLGVEQVDIHNSKRTNRVEHPVEDAAAFIADENGRVRIMARLPSETSGMMGDRMLFYYRPLESSSWEKLGVADLELQSQRGFNPVAVDSARNVVYGFDNEDGYSALYSIALDGSGRREELVGRDDVDVDGLMRIGRKNRVVGASYATEERQVAYFDDALERLARDLGEALPGKPLINIIDASQDESRLLIIASSDTDPGMTYLYDKQTRQLSELLPLRDPLVGAKLGEMRPITYPAADGTQIPGYLTLPPGVTEARDLPAIVLPHGGPTARDEWGFDWLVQFFASQGYAVLQPNFRGSSGYGNDWFGKNGFQAWRTAIGDVNDAGRWLVSQGTADPDKLAIVGWSYGGYAALQSQVVDPQLYKAVVAIAPVADLELLREQARDFTYFTLFDRFIGRGDHVSAGSPAQNAEAFAAPVLLFHGTADQNVYPIQSRRMKEKLESAGKQVSYVEFANLEHSLDDTEARVRMLTEAARFLKAALGS